MSIFNPQGQYGNDPNYLNYPRVIDMPATQFAELTNPQSMVGDIAKSLHGAVGFTDAAIKEGIKNEAYKQVDPEREKFTTALENVKKQLDQGTIPAATSGGSSLLDAHAEASDDDLPDGVSNGIDRVQLLAQARAAGSPKINDTQYSAAVLSKAKQMRSQYQGYREEVDQAVSQASGLPVANSYYQNLMQDINRQLVQMGKANKDPLPKIMEHAMSSGMPNAEVYYQQYQSGDTAKGPEFLKQWTSWNNLKAQQEIDARQRAASKDDLEVQKVNETKNLTKRLNDTTNHYITDNLALAGLPSLRDTMDYLRQVNATGKYNDQPQGDEQVFARTQQLAAYRTMIYQQLKNQAGGSEQILGGPEVDKMINSAMTPIDGYVQLAAGKDGHIGMAVYHMQQNKNIQEDSFNNVLVNKDTGAGTRMLLTARKTFGDQYFPFWVQNAPQNVQESVQGLYQQEKLFAVQDGTDARGQPLPPRKLIDAVKHAKKVQNPDPNLYDSYTKIVSGITDPNMPADMKDKLISWGFDPKNKGLINEFRQDYRDQNGNLVPGKFAAFNRLTSPSITDAVAQSARAKPEQYKNYREFAESEFANAFRGDLADLNKILGKSYLNAHFGWDSDTGHFILVDKNNRTIQPQPRAMGVERPDTVYLNSALDTLKRVNEMGVDNLVKVYTADPNPNKGDIGSYLLRTLQTSGFRPGENITNASEGMAKAIIKTKRPEITLEDMDKVLFGGK